MSEKTIDLRSDTVTQPTDAMRAAMAAAPVGDDVFGEDPAVNELEATAARILGKESALFVTSGTMGNQLAVLAQAQPGDEIICEASSHIFLNEAGALARIGGVQAATVTGALGCMPLDKVETSIRDEDIHHPPTALICVENTHNAHGGAALPIAYLQDLKALAERRGLPVHMDGARLFNACVCMGLAAKDIALYADTVTFCLSKGLCAPVGSVLCGPEKVIARARKFRKMLGGGMRQAGVLAAAGLVALHAMVDRLREDHEGAALLANALGKIPGVEVAYSGTNIAYFTLPSYITAGEALGAMKERGVLMMDFSDRVLRLVTHHGISRADCERVGHVLQEVLAR